VTRFLLVAGAIGLTIAVVINIAAIVTAVQAPSFADRWEPVLKRNEAACSWVEDCRPS
jgi:hypothetical protein